MSSKVDWKTVSKSAGYKSLKAAYVRDVQLGAHDLRRGRSPMRDKPRYRRHFKRAIALAMHYAHEWDLPIETVLDYWESQRDYWWLNFYQKGNLMRLKPSL